MKRRKWTPEQKAWIVLEGHRERSTSKLCNEYCISKA